MGYALKNTSKHERKLGYQAVEELLADPNWTKASILAYAKLNEKVFAQIDEMDDVNFCQNMDAWRNNHPDAYKVFWWWRKANEEASKNGEEDGYSIKETGYRCFMVTQFLALPFSDVWEADRLHLKQGVAPLITEDIIKEGLDHKVIKQWAYILHCRDIYTEEDEISDRRGLVKAGDRKFAHWHIMLSTPSKVPVSTIARWFQVPPNQVEIMSGRGAFLDGVEYLVHESPKAVEQHKTHYDDDEMVASKGFDFRKEINDLQRHRALYGKRAGDMTPADTMRMHVMQDGWTMRQCREDDPLTYAKIRNTLPSLRLDYLMDADPCPFRLNIYVDGPGGIGKTSFCRYIAQTLFSAYDTPYFPVGNDKRVTFDGYDGEPCLLWNDMKLADFVDQFTPNGAYKIFDPHPDKEAQQAKHSRVILTNAVNIINGVEPYEEFIAGLADLKDANQAWRRFPMILRIRENDFDILLNEGFINNDLSSIQTMMVYNNVRGSMKAIQEKLGGHAREMVLEKFGKPVIDAVHMIETKHDEKVSDPDQLPAEFQDYGTVKTADDLRKEKQEEAEDRFLEEIEAYETMRFDALIKFANWFWLTGSAAPVRIMQTYAGMIVYDPELKDDLARQWELPFTLSDDVIRKLADLFAPIIKVPVEVMNSYSVDMLRSSLRLCWTGHPAFALDEASREWAGSKYAWVNPYHIPEQIDLTTEPEPKPESSSLSDERAYDPETNTILKCVDLTLGCPDQQFAKQGELQRKMEKTQKKKLEEQ